MSAAVIDIKGQISLDDDSADEPNSSPRPGNPATSTVTFDISSSGAKSSPRIPPFARQSPSPLMGGLRKQVPDLSLRSASHEMLMDYLKTPTVPDLLRTPTMMMVSPTSKSPKQPNSSCMMHIDELNTPSFGLNSSTPKNAHTQAFFGDHEPLLTGGFT